MKRFVWSLALAFALSFSSVPLARWPAPIVVSAQKSVHVKGYTTKSGKVVKPYDRKPPASKTSCATCGRDKAGRIARSEAAKDAFMRETGYPHGRPGYVVDHILPLACGGLDAPTNMQWQTTAEAKAKDKVERKGCVAA